ncbi:MAG: flagellar filament capping protein FliD, partial [Bryobacteraceae bacterium]
RDLLGTIPNTLYFTGVSSYSADLNSVISRAVAIASFPLQLMQNTENTLQSKAFALKDLDTKFTAIQTALSSLSTAIGPNSYTATSSDPSTVVATAAAGALAATYTVEVSDAGSSTSTLSQAALTKVVDPFASSISSSSAFTLTVNGNTYGITPGGAGLMDLASAINNSSAGVQASVVNLGDSGSPDYRLSIRSNKLAPDTIQLNDGSSDLLDTLSTGGNAAYTVNGIATVIHSDSPTVDLAPGVSAQLLQTNVGFPATVTVGQDNANLLKSLNSFISAYNTGVDALDAQHGSNPGILSGDPTLNSLSDALRQMTQYSPGSGPIANLAAIGVTLDNTGHLILDQTAFDAVDTQTMSDFLGSVDTGGFLKMANDALNTVEDPDSGVLKIAISSNTDQQTTANDNIATEQQRVDDMTANLVLQMAASDALIAQLESQKSYMTALFAPFTQATGSTPK